MRQNRVDPFGNIIRTEARGSLWGNRGALHNENQEIIRPFRLEQWITCTLVYKGIRRKIMAPNRLTELFFLDEATSFAAGHRPCALCRRPAFDAFKSSWLKGNAKYGFDPKTSIREIDHILHIERIDKHMRKITYEENPRDLPDGTFVVYKGDPCLLKNQQLHKWTPFGYDRTITISEIEKLEVLTPRSVVNVFRSGYVPAMSISSETADPGKMKVSGNS
jgi:hypothetical protein